MPELDDHEWLAQQFEARRPHLRAVAYRMLSSPSEADDAVQESWLRLSRADTSGVENLGGWLTTVTARICLDMLRARGARHEESLEAHPPEAIEGIVGEGSPEDQALLADAVGLALLVVLDTLNPAERLAFVLHDLFDVPFDEIAPIVGRTPTAARQLASRARRRVQGASAESDAEANRARKRAVVDAFLAAARAGDFAALLTMLDPEVVLRTDAAALATGAVAAAGAHAVAEQFSGRAHAAKLALLNGAPGAVWGYGGEVRVAFLFTIANDTITAIEILADPDRLAALHPTLLDD